MSRLEITSVRTCNDDKSGFLTSKREFYLPHIEMVAVYACHLLEGVPELRISIRLSIRH